MEKGAQGRLLFIMVVLGLCGAYIGLGVFGKTSENNRDALYWMAAMKSLPAWLLGVWTLVAAFDGSVKNNAAKTYSWMVGVGLLLGGGGDFCLELEKYYPFAFILGLVSFLIGHVFYIGGFMATGLKYDGVMILVPICLGYVGVLLSILIPSIDKEELKIPVVVYAGVIASMAILSFLWKGDQSLSKSAVSRGTSWWLAFIGALVFVASDSVLAINKFATPFDSARLITMVTYYAAQILFYYSAVYLRSGIHRKSA